MTSHVEARDILARAVPGIHPADSLLVRVISMLEAQYGDGWRAGDAGHGSHNWGAIQAGPSWTGDTFEHQDSRWDPESETQTTYVTKFRRYPSSEAGARDLFRVLSSPRHRRAIELARAGRWSEVSHALGPLGSGFYEGFGPPASATEAHRKRFASRRRDIMTATGESTLDRPPSWGWLPVLVLAALWGWSRG